MAFLLSVLEKTGKADIIIDDGSHVGHDMKSLFTRLFSTINSGGFYVVEDTHCLYEPHYNQGSKAFEFFTGLVRDIDVAGRGMTGNQDYAIDKAVSETPVPAYSRILKAAHFYPSLYIFERK